jgi:hypothetical protein
MKRSIPAYWEVTGVDPITARNTRTNEVFVGTKQQFLTLINQETYKSPPILASAVPPEGSGPALWFNTVTGRWSGRTAEEWLAAEVFDVGVYSAKALPGFLKSGVVGEPADYPRATPRLQFAYHDTTALTGITGQMTDGTIVISCKNGTAYLGVEELDVPNRNWLHALYAFGKFILIAPNHFAYSVDGYEWIEGVLPIERTWTTAVVGSKAVIMAADMVCHSVDGINWLGASVSLGGLPSQAMATDAGFAAVANGKLITSTNGFTWSIGINATTIIVQDGVAKTLASLGHSSALRAFLIKSTDGMVVRETIFYVYADKLVYDIDGKTHTAPPLLATAMIRQGDFIHSLVSGVPVKHKFKQLVGQAISHNINGLDLYVKVA